MNINIISNRYGSLFAYNEEGWELFQFEYRKKNLGGPAWYFWLRGNFDPDIFNGKKSQFPMEFFLSAVRAKSFILCGKGIDESVNIASGLEYISKK